MESSNLENDGEKKSDEGAGNLICRTRGSRRCWNLKVSNISEIAKTGSQLINVNLSDMAFLLRFEKILPQEWGLRCCTGLDRKGRSQPVQFVVVE